MDRPKKPGVIFYAVMFAMVFLTTIAHELVHLLTALAFGVERVAFGLGRVSYLPPVPWEDFVLQQSIISISGPVFTVILGLFGAWLAVSKRIAFGYQLIFLALFFRLVAMGMSVATGVHNDEARVSLDLGLDWWALPAVGVVILTAAFIAASRRLRFGFLVLFLSYLTASLGFTALIYLDGQLPGQERCDSVLAPFFDPEFGC